MNKNAIWIIILLIGIILPASSFAEEGLNVSDVEIMSIKEDKVFGNFTLTNNSLYYLPEVSYVLNLLTEDQVGEETYVMSINNEQAVSFELLPEEEKSIFFEYELPDNLPQKEYAIYLRVSQKDTTMDEWKKYGELGVLGQGDDFIKVSERTLKLLVDAAKVDNITIMPELNKKTTVPLSMRSFFDKKIVATPHIKIYSQSITSTVPAINYQAEKITFMPGKIQISTLYYRNFQSRDNILLKSLCLKEINKFLMNWSFHAL